MSDLDEVQKDIGNLRKTVDAYHEEVITHITECKACRASVARHEMILEGPPENGSRPGLRIRFDRVEGIVIRGRLLLKWAAGILSALIIAGLTVWLGLK